VDIVLVMLVLTNVFLFFSSRLMVHIRVVAVQGLLLGLLPILHAGDGGTGRLLAMSAVTIAIKAVLLPLLMARIVRSSGVLRESGLRIGPVASSLAGVALLGLSSWLAANLPLPTGVEGSRLLTVALFTALSGLFHCIARDRLPSQALGVLILENGVLIAGLTVPHGGPSLVELGILLDVTVAIFVMGVLIRHVSRTFRSLDADCLAELKD
jgi:hydrogenase-4 component E